MSVPPPQLPTCNPVSPDYRTFPTSTHPPSFTSLPPPCQETVAKTEDYHPVDQQELRLRILKLFRRDKAKHHEICDRFMNLMQVEDVVGKVDVLIEFIQKAAMVKGETFQLANGKDATVGTVGQHSHKTLGVFSCNVGFIASVFNRDKVEVLINVHSAHQKVLNFLRFLHASLQSFNFTNQKQWILMKDEIQRHFIKYEKNINRLLQINEPHPISSSKNKNKPPLSSQPLSTPTLLPTKKPRKNTTIYPLLQQQLNMTRYKKDITGIKQKIKQLQSSMCIAVRNSFTAWYEKFEVLLDTLKGDLGYVCALIEKADHFKPSQEKQQIKEFLLATRSKGMEAVIFLEQVYRFVIVRLEEARIELSTSVTMKFCKGVIFIEQEKERFVSKEQSVKEFTEKLFRKFQMLLNVKKGERAGWMRNVENSMIMVDESDSQGQSVIRRESLIEKTKVNQKQKQKERKQYEKQTEPIQKEKKIKKEHKRERNVVIRSSQVTMDKGRIMINLTNEDEQNNVNSDNIPPNLVMDEQEMKEQQPEQSSSLQFLMSQSIVGVSPAIDNQANNTNNISSSMSSNTPTFFRPACHNRQSPDWQPIRPKMSVDLNEQSSSSLSSSSLSSSSSSSSSSSGYSPSQRHPSHSSLSRSQHQPQPLLDNPYLSQQSLNISDDTPLPLSTTKSKFAGKFASKEEIEQFMAIYDSEVIQHGNGESCQGEEVGQEDGEEKTMMMKQKG